MEKGSERMPDIKLTELNAISPLDGRYWKDVKEISGFSSE